MLLSGGAADKLTSPTVNLPSGEMVLIEEEYTPQNLPTVSHSHRYGTSALLTNANVGFWLAYSFHLQGCVLKHCILPSNLYVIKCRFG